MSVIKIINGSKSEDATKTPSQANPDSISEQTGADKNAVGKWIATKIATEVVQEAVSWTSFEINKSLNLHDDYVGQRNLQLATQTISKATSIASSIISTAQIGSMFGPAGAAIGAAIGAVTSVASNAIQTAKEVEQERIRLDILDTQLGFTRSRAGWSTTAGSIGEDL